MNLNSLFTIPGKLLLALVLALLISAPVQATSVILKTTLGYVEIDLYEDATPVTVANFLNYVQDGDYLDSFIHRSVPGFVIQGGGFTFDGTNPIPVPEDAPIANEPGISNLRGTIAMAKVEGDPNSATSQWFINLADNSAELDDSNGGFTVFGEVMGNGMEIIDAIAALQVWNAGTSFTEIPLIDFPGTGPIQRSNLVMAEMFEPAEFIINPGVNDAWYDPTTPGQGFFITVFPDSNMIFLAWFTYETERPDGSIQAMLGEPGHRWLTAFGAIDGNTANLEIELTQGGVFDSSTPMPSQSADGTIVLEFSDCENGTITYDIVSVNLQGSIPIERIAPDNVGYCKQLLLP